MDGWRFFNKALFKLFDLFVLLKYKRSEIFAHFHLGFRYF